MLNLSRLGDIKNTLDIFVLNQPYYLNSEFRPITWDCCICDKYCFRNYAQSK